MALEKFGSADDWHLEGNQSISSAALKSDEECVSIRLRDRFQKAGCRLPPPESLEWAIPLAEWPKEMNIDCGGGSGGDCTPTKRGGNELGSARKKPRTGNGKAKPSK